jgi:hypothetical protein
MRTDAVKCLLRTTPVVILALGLAGSIARAAQQNKQFEERRSAILTEFGVEQKKLGLERKDLYAKYPTAEIAFSDPVSVSPGATLPIVLSGKIAEGAVVLSGNDAAQLAGALAQGRYNGKMTVAPGSGPGFVSVYVLTPVSGATTAGSVAFINVANSYDLRGTNGWTIKLVPAAKAFTVSKSEAVLPYRVDFYRANETKPFETRDSELRLSASAQPGAPHEFSLRERQAVSGVQAEYEALLKKMSDPNAMANMSDAESEKLGEQFAQLQERMMKEVMAAASDPTAAAAAQQQKQDEFGCGSLQISSQGGKVTGSVWCGKNVGMFDVTGTSASAQ